MAKTKRPYDPNRIRHVKKPFEKRRKSGKEEIEEYTRSAPRESPLVRLEARAVKNTKRTERKADKRERKNEEFAKTVRKYITKYRNKCGEEGKNFVRPFCRKKPVRKPR